MTDSDELILEFLADTEIALPPTPIHYNLQKNHEISYSTVRRRTQTLTEHGFLEIDNPDKKYYQITELGRQYLMGNLNASELENESDEY
ncbi:hypothetical protein [Halorussus salinus]|uniref:hypothetical protein n=1 Tax=Halorussus salinus TaxID=1364935 RepID=UPI00109265E5|nr:hypothetical protein [Halorussus salinus]